MSCHAVNRPATRVPPSLRSPPGLCNPLACANPAAGTVPECVYSSGDMATGEKILVLEDLGAGTVTGNMLGAMHPYTWDKREEVEAATKAGPGPEVVIAQTFAATSVHSTFPCVLPYPTPTLSRATPTAAKSQARRAAVQRRDAPPPTPPPAAARPSRHVACGPTGCLNGTVTYSCLHPQGRGARKVLDVGGSPDLAVAQPPPPRPERAVTHYPPTGLAAFLLSLASLCVLRAHTLHTNRTGSHLRFIGFAARTVRQRGVHRTRREASESDVPATHEMLNGFSR